MKRHNLLGAGIITLLLCNCGSPPEPPKVDWNSGTTTINSEIPSITDTHNVISAANVSGHWNSQIVFVDHYQLWPPEVRFAVVHSTSIIIDAPDTIDYFKAKSWLQKNGATAKVISFHKSTSLTPQTKINLYR